MDRKASSSSSNSFTLNIKSVNEHQNPYNTNQRHNSNDSEDQLEFNSDSYPSSLMWLTVFLVSFYYTITFSVKGGCIEIKLTHSLGIGIYLLISRLMDIFIRGNSVISIDSYQRLVEASEADSYRKKLLNYAVPTGILLFCIELATFIIISISIEKGYNIAVVYSLFHLEILFMVLKDLIGQSNLSLITKFSLGMCVFLYLILTIKYLGISIGIGVLSICIAKFIAKSILDELDQVSHGGFDSRWILLVDCLIGIVVTLFYLFFKREELYFTIVENIKIYIGAICFAFNLMFFRKLDMLVYNLEMG